MIRIGRVMLFAKDVARMRTFYGALLEQPPIEDAADWVVFESGGVQLALHAYAGDIEITDPPLARSDVAIKYTFFVPDVAAARVRLAAVGAHMRDAKTFGPRTVCDGLDPEGNVFQISNR